MAAYIVYQNATNASETYEYLTLETLNRKETIRLIPVIVYLVFLAISGAAGNIIVFHVYRTKYRVSNSKYFVLCLCMIDLFSCIVAIPLEISTVIYQFTFENTWLCKASRFCNYIGAMSSSLLICLIAVERYRKVCQPFEWQISTTAGKYLSLVCVFNGIMAALPALFIFGKKRFVDPTHGVVGTECSTDDLMKDTTLPTFHVVLSGGLFAVDVLLIVVLYVLIGRTILKHERTVTKHFCFKKEGSPEPASQSQSQEVDLVPYSRGQSADELENMDKTKGQTTDKNQTLSGTKISKRATVPFTFKSNLAAKSDDIKSLSNHSQKTLCVSQNNGMLAPVSSLYPRLSQDTSKGSTLSLNTGSRSSSQVFQNSDTLGKVTKDKLRFRRISSRQASTRKTALLMFMVSVAFILSYTPHLILMFCRLIDDKFIDNMSDSGRAVYKFFLRSYFVNYAINPVIYCLCGTKFRSYCKELLCGKCRPTST